MCINTSVETNNISCDCDRLNANDSNKKKTNYYINPRNHEYSNSNNRFRNSMCDDCQRKEYKIDSTETNIEQKCLLSIDDTSVVMAAVGTIDGKVYVVSSNNTGPLLIKRLAGPITNLTFMHINITALFSNELGNTLR